MTAEFSRQRASDTVKCNLWFATIVYRGSPRVEELPVIHPLSYEFYRIRCAVFFAETTA
jgi:hypothetical protein